MKYDAFISYRREQNFMTAQIINDRLKEKGLSCFLDLEEDKAGKFNKRIIRAIESSPNFILVLSKKSLNRCSNEKDWVRREIMKAIELNKTVIPVRSYDFEWSEKLIERLPKPIAKLQHQQNVLIVQEYLPAVIDKIISYMTDININSEYCSNTLSSRQFIESAIENNDVEYVDMAFHAGSNWRQVTDNLNLVSKIIHNKIKIRVIINTPEAVTDICSHMQQPLKKYISFDQSIENWLELQRLYPENVAVKVLDTPLLHRLYIIRSQSGFVKLNVKSYTYGCEIGSNDFSYTFTSKNPQCDIYLKEFDYIWNNM